MSNFIVWDGEVVLQENDKKVAIRPARREDIPYLNKLLKKWNEKQYYLDKEGNLKIAEGLELGRFYEKAVLNQKYSLNDMYSYYSRTYKSLKSKEKGNIKRVSTKDLGVRLDELLGMLLFTCKNQFIVVDGSNEKFYEENKELIDMLINYLIDNFDIFEFDFDNEDMLWNVFGEAIGAINWATTYCKNVDSKKAYLDYFSRCENESIIKPGKAMEYKKVI